jgi:membrane protein
MLVIGSFSLVVLGGVIEDWLGGRLGYSDALVTGFAVVRWVLVLAATTLGIAFIYRFAPNVRKPLRFIWPGSVFATAMLILASAGFSTYIAHFADYSATYGSIGAVIVLMFWLYIAGLVILVGSEINAA